MTDKDRAVHKILDVSDRLEVFAKNVKGILGEDSEFAKSLLDMSETLEINMRTIDEA